MSLIIVGVAVTIYVVQARKGMADFEVYRTAAGRALNAENLYRPEDGHYQYKYWPAFAFAVAPVALVDDGSARLAWYALSFGLLCLFIRWSVQSVPDKRLTQRALFWFAILFVGKYYARELYLGQANFLLGTVLLGAFLAAEAGSRRTAGALVAVGVFVKPYALILLPWLWFAAGLPSLVAGGVVFAAGLFLPALAYGWNGNIDQILGWYRTVTDTSAPNLLKEENISFATAWAKWVGPGPLARGLAIATGATCLGAVGVVMARRRLVSRPGCLEFGFLMLLVPVLSPQGWDYLLLLATPAILCIVDRWRELSRGWQVVSGAAIGVTSFTIFDLLGRSLYESMMEMSVLSAAVLALVACLVNLRWRRLA